jgi:hypothetical protein
MTEKIREKDGSLTSESLAELIIDALLDAKIIKEADFKRAVEIAEEEIDVRKAAGDY